MKSFAGASENERTGKIKVSRDGSESGSYFDKDQLAAMAKSAWVGVVSLAAEQGAQAQGLRVGNVPATIKPHVHASQFDEVVVTIAGQEGTPVHIDQAATTLGHPIDDWQKWGGGGGTPATTTTRAGVPAVAVAEAARISLAGAGLEGAGYEVLLNAMKVAVAPSGTLSVNELAALAAQLAGIGETRAALAICLACAAEPRPATVTAADEVEAYEGAAAVGKSAAQALAVSP